MSGVEESVAVTGERTTARVEQARSLHSRMSNLLAVGLMSALGLSALTWYYANAMSRQDRSRRSAQATASARAQGDMALPSLGRIDAPVLETRAPLPPPPDLPVSTPTTLPEIPLDPYAPPASTASAPTPKTAAEVALERRLSSVVFAASSAMPGGTVMPATGTPAGTTEASAGGSGFGLVAPSAASATNPGAVAAQAGPGPAASNPEPSNLAPLLRTHVAASVPAQILATRRLLLPKGAFIDCTLETAIDSTLPGMTTCVLATDTFGADGKVVLLERGTKLTGETRGQVQQGSARVFVLWSEARTPAGVIVPLDSPGADELGRAGLPGEVNHHFWARFGAAILVSVIDGAVQAGVQSSSRHDSTSIVLNPSPTQDIMGEVLKGSINIPPTVVKRNGDRIQVLVARDLDFRSVYELRAAVAH